MIKEENQINNFPEGLKHIPDPPKKLFYRGVLPDTNTKMLCIVGSRNHSSYGEKVCREIIYGLKGKNICIVSGLAIGIDTIAHKSALEIGLKTIAFPGSGLDESVLYPFQNKDLAEKIILNEGAVISEFDLLQRGAGWTFPRRNRLMAGISDATIIIEAREKSGTLITARLATDYNKNVGAIPGSIFSELSFGPNELIRQGATPIINSDNVLELLGLNTKLDDKCESINNSNVNINSLIELSREEKTIVEILKIEPRNAEQLIEITGLNIRELNTHISVLEICGLVENNEGEFIFLG